MEMAGAVVVAGPDRLRATLVGTVAVLLWATLALLTTMSGNVPPFQLVAMAFFVGFLLAVGKWVLLGQSALRYLRQPLPVWALGVGGLFGFHFFYFVALRNAPAVDASLISYLWPLLIVVLSSVLLGERLRWWHFSGALLGLTGTALLVTRGGSVSFSSEYLLGYGSALGCALTWSLYSVLNRRYEGVPTDAVGGFCGATSLLALLCHVLFETTVWPQGGGEWLAILGLGLGPVGAAFYVWDYGTKHGDIRALGVISYAAPLLSTLLLIVFGRGAASWVVAAACVLIVGGALLASQDVLRRRR